MDFTAFFSKFLATPFFRTLDPGLVRTVHLHSLSVLCPVRSMISKSALDIIKLLFMKKDLLTVMCAGRSTELKKTLEIK